MKNSQLSRSLYVTSIVYGYFLTFLVAVPAIGLIITKGIDGVLSNTAGIFVFSLIIAIPVIIIAAFIGFPIFKLIEKQIELGHFFNVMISGIGSAFSCAVILLAGCFLVMGVSLEEIGFIVFVFVPAVLGVALLSACILWWRTNDL